MSCLFCLLPQDLFTCICVFLTSAERCTSLSHLSHRLHDLHIQAAWKGQHLISDQRLINQLINSHQLRRNLSSMHTLSLREEQHYAIAEQPGALIDALLPLLRLHISDIYLLSQLSLVCHQQSTTHPQDELLLCLMALLSYASPSFTHLRGLCIVSTTRQRCVQLALPLSSLAFPALTTVILSGILCSTVSLAPLFNFPSLLHIDLSSSILQPTQQSFQSLLRKSGANDWLHSLLMPIRDFWGNLDSVCALMNTPASPRLQRLPTHPLTDDDPDSLIAYKNNKGLRWFRPCSLISASDWPHLVHMPKLKRLDLNECWFLSHNFLAFVHTLDSETDATLPPFSALTTLIATEYDVQQQTEGVDYDTDTSREYTQTLCTFLHLLPHLHHLALTMPPLTIFTAEVAQQLCNMKKLERLELASQPQLILTPQSLAPFFCTTLPQLTHLALTRVCLPDEAILTLIQSMPQLSRLHLCDCSQFSVSGLMLITEHCTQLHSLQVDRCSDLKLTQTEMDKAKLHHDHVPVVLSNVSRCSQLNRLEIRLSCIGVQSDHSGLVQVLSLFSAATDTLQYLSIHSHTLYDQDVLLLAQFPALKALSIWDHTDAEHALALYSNVQYTELHRPSPGTEYHLHQASLYKFQENDKEDSDYYKRVEWEHEELQHILRTYTRVFHSMGEQLQRGSGNAYFNALAAVAGPGPRASGSSLEKQESFSIIDGSIGATAKRVHPAELEDVSSRNKSRATKQGVFVRWFCCGANAM